MTMKKKIVCAILAGAATIASPAMAADFSFVGNFTADDNVQFFDFVVGGISNVTLRTYSYAGGTNAAGAVIDRGGFDPILALYDLATGARVASNDDGATGTVLPDPLTGLAYDTFLMASLDAGTYRVAVTQFDNFGPDNLSEAFPRTGATFTSKYGCSQGFFCDLGANSRDSHWAFDVLNVESAISSDVPEPASWALMLVGFGGMGYAMRRNRKVAVSFS